MLPKLRAAGVSFRKLACWFCTIMTLACVADEALARQQNAATAAAPNPSVAEQETAIKVASGMAYRNVPASAKSRNNPYQSRADIAAGGRLYVENCLACHGRDALGSTTAPSLQGGGTAAAPPGAIFWFITRGDIARKMPPWGQVLSQRERWQIVSYLKSGVRHPAIKAAKSRSPQ